MGQLTIEFRGICSHFVNCVPGVPHRVVLPDTRGFNMGTLTAPGVTDAAYALPPHYAMIQNDDVDPLPIGFEPYVVDNSINWGVRVEIANPVLSPTIQTMDYPPDSDGVFSFTNIPRLSTYTTTPYRFSTDVVMGGRAMCYFDLFAGTVTAQYANGPGTGLRTIVAIETNGDPILKLSPLLPTRDALSVAYLPVASRLIVANHSDACPDANFDFLWHFLTIETSIPRVLRQQPPGFDNKGCPETDLTNALQRALHGQKPEGTDPTDTSASCSNSQYP